MTRGKFVLFTSDRVYVTTEFNGDMYYDGYGKESAEKIKRVNTPEDLLDLAVEINKEHYDYPEEEIVIRAKSDYNSMLNMDDYFMKYFSDYIYIKNVSGRDLTFDLKNGKYVLPNQESGVLNYGRSANEEFPDNLNGFRPVEE